jgi:hypothetical protein
MDIVPMRCSQTRTHTHIEVSGCPTKQYEGDGYAQLKRCMALQVTCE